MKLLQTHYTLVRKLSLTYWLLVVSLCISNSRLFAQLPSGFSKSVVQNGYTTPIGMVFSTDGNQFFVWDISGKVWVSTWNGSTYSKQSTAVVDISEEVLPWKDLGLQSICLDPNFQTNGLIYLFYTVDPHHLLYFGTSQYSSTTTLVDHATISRVTRYRIQNTGGTLTTVPNSRTVLLGETKTTGIPVTKETHAGGTVLFGRDGTLLVATGDGAYHEGVDAGSKTETNYLEALNQGIMRANENVGAFRAQMVNSMCGKVLRIDSATGNGLPSNPFYDAANPRAPNSRVWTLGLRNPYRITLKPNTGSTNISDGNPGTLLVADVGWYKVEDFHVVDKAGLNCGWPLYEGLEPTISYYGTNVLNLDEPGQPTFESLCPQPTTFIDNPNPALRRFTHSRPALDYSHSPARTRVPAFNGTTPITRTIGTTGAPAGTSFAGNCIIGGVYYTGTQFPSTYQNTYFFVDHGIGWIKNLVLHDEGDHVVHEVRNFAPDNYEPGILDMKMNPRDGSLYYIQVQGSVGRISFGGNQPPVANASSNVTYGTSPLSVTFTGSNSVDPEGLPLTYLWNFGDGTTSTAPNPVHVFSSIGVQGFTVTLTVKDNLNQQSLPKEIIISVNNTPPAVQITNPAPGTLYPMSQATSYTLAANVTDTDLTNLGYEWQLSLRHNNHTHPEPVLTGANPIISISPVGCSPNESYSYLLTLKVTDRGGLTATNSVTLSPDCSSASSLVSNVTATSQLNAVLVNWINPTVAFDEILVAAREGQGFQDKPSSTTYVAHASFTGNGSPIEGGKVVYRGIGTNVTVTSLNPLNQYYFRVYTRLDTTWNGGVEVTATPNLPPIPPTIGLQTATPNQTFTYTVPAFTDPEGQTLTYAATNLPASFSFNSGTRVLSGLPTQVGGYTIYVIATDPGSLTALVPVIINVGANQPPVPPSLTAQTAEVGLPFSYTVPAFSDPENQALTYTATGLPTGLSFNTTTRVVSGTPTVGGSYTVVIKATDPGSLTASANLVIVINAVCSMITVKTGNWGDPTVWSCNRIPSSSDAVQLNHIVSLPDGYTGFARKVMIYEGGRLKAGTNASVQLSQ